MRNTGRGMIPASEARKIAEDNKPVKFSNKYVERLDRDIRMWSEMGTKFTTITIPGSDSDLVDDVVREVSELGYLVSGYVNSDYSYTVRVDWSLEV